MIQSRKTIDALVEADRELSRLQHAVEWERHRAEAAGDMAGALDLHERYRALSVKRREVSRIVGRQLLQPDVVRAVARQVSAASARARTAVVGLARLRRILERIAEVLGHVDRLLAVAI